MRKHGVVLLALFAVTFLFCLFSQETIPTANAEIEWDFDDATGTLTISGSGRMKDYSYSNNRYQEWWSLRNNISTVIIEDGVTAIGVDAFREMPALEQVIMDDSVTELGTGCFSNCSKLQYIDFSPNIQKVGMEAFINCVSLESVIFPHKAFDFPSLTDMRSNGTYMFNGCTNLKYIEFPDNWSTIPPLQRCTSLEEIVFPSNITKFSSSTFSQSNIKEITIPTSVTTLPWCLFDESKVEKMIIPQTVTQFGSRNSYTWYYKPKGNCEFYVVEGSAAQEWLKSHGYQYTLISPSLNEIQVPSGEACIMVKDELGKPIFDATVSYGNTTEKTNGSGIAYFTEEPNETPVITVTKNGYETWSNQGTCWIKKKPALYQITLFQGGTNGLKLASAYYDGIGNCDLLTETKKIFICSEPDLIYKPGDGHFKLTCSTVNPSLASRYILIQGDRVIEESLNGVFMLTEDQFRIGEKSKVRTYDQYGDYYDSPIHLIVEESGVNEKTSIKFDKAKVEFKIDDGIPLLGGQTFEFDMSKVFEHKLHLVATDSEIEVGLNINQKSGPKESMKEARDFFNNLKKSGSLKPGRLSRMSKSQQKTFEKLQAETNEAALFTKAKVNCLGYGKYDKKENKLSIDIVITFSTTAVSFSQTFYVVVPVVVSAELDLEAATQFGLSYDIDTQEFDADLTISPSAKLKGFAGVGVGDLVGAGVYGSLKLSGEFEILPDFGVNTADLEGELGIKAYIGPFEHEKAYAYQKWNLYTRDEVGSQSIGEDEQYGLYDSRQYKRSNRDYLLNESAWLGEADPDNINAMNLVNTDFQMLLTGTYRNAQPQMVSSSNKIYATFLRANAEGTGIQTVLTSFDGTSWGVPVVVDENAYADNAPTLCVDQNGTIWLAYAKTNATEVSTLQEYAENQSIVVGRVDPETLAFCPSQEYTSQGYAHGQKLTTVDGEAALVWLDSVIENDDDVLWPGASTIYSVYCGEDGEWDADPMTVTNVEGTVTDIAVGADENRLKIGYFMDTDGNPSTKDDIALYETTSEGNMLQAENCAGKLKIAKTGNSQVPLYVWNETDLLCFSDGTKIEAAGISREFVVLEDRIYYSADTDGQADLFVMYYSADKETWSNPIRLTNSGRYFENISVAELNGQYYTLGMHTEATITDDNVTDDKNLVWAQIRTMNDLCLADADYDHESLIPGEDMTVTLFIDNMGDHDVHSVEIEELGQVYECEIARGATAELEVTIPCPKRLTEYTYTVNEPGETDATPDNNSYSVSIGYSDLSLIARLNKNNGKYSIIAVVENEGIEPTKGTVIFSGDNGTEYAHVDLNILKAGSIGFATLEIDDTIMPGFDLDIHVAVESSKEEWTESNNSTDIRESFEVIDGDCGTNAYWAFTRDGVLSITGQGAIKPIAGIWPWQRLRSRIQSITVAEGITGIQGSGAFSNCAIPEAALPDSMTDCGTYTYSGCNLITAFAMPPLTQSVPAGMFSGCQGLTGITLSPLTESIEQNAFGGCILLEEVQGSEQVTTIGYGAFERCQNLTEFAFSEDEMSIGEMAFEESGLQEIELTSGTIGFAAFYGCDQLTDAIIGCDISQIDFYAFADCSQLETIQFLGDDTVLQEQVFFNAPLANIHCRNISTAYRYAKENEIPYTLTNEKAEPGIVMPAGTKAIEAQAFEAVGFISVKLNPELESIGSRAFANCEFMTQIEIPANVTEIEEDAFDECNSLLIIFCTKDSEAHKFAENSGIDFILEQTESQEED